MIGHRPTHWSSLRVRTMRVVTIAPLLLLSPGAAPAPGQVQPYGFNDGGGFHDVLPPGNDGTVNAAEGARFLVGGIRPPHTSDQLPLYRDLLYASPGLGAADISRYFVDGTFGVKPEDELVRYSPREDVTVIRDRQFGRPHVYGSTRAGTMFGAGYVAAEDRLFMMDIFRNTGRGSLSSFLGGSPDYRKFDHDQWRFAPYLPGELRAQIDRGRNRGGREGRQIYDDASSYVDGINSYIAQARLDVTKMPVEYAAIGRSPEPFQMADIVAISTVIAAQVGSCTCDEVSWATLLQDFQRKFGRLRGHALWAGLRAADDPESPATVLRRRFPFQPLPRRPRSGSAVLPDRGSLRAVPVVAPDGSGGRAGQLSRMGRGLRGALQSLTGHHNWSNALLVSARESASGRPLAVFGPQLGFFSTEPFLLQELHGPGIDAAGASLAGVSFYIEVGHGRDYAWSATNAHNDVVDTFAIPLCEPDGRPATIASMHYRFRGRCLPIEVIEHRNSWTPNQVDQTPAGSETLRAERTKLGLITHRATVRGRPHAFARLRATYFHEIDSVLGFYEFNDPAKIRDARSFQRAAAKIAYGFNWFYVDARDIAYINGGANNPIRPAGVDPRLPVSSRFTWRGFDPQTNTARYARFQQMPQVINQSYIVNWNNRQARGHTFPDPIATSVTRSQLLESRVRAGVRGRRKMTLEQLVDAMTDAATADLRGERVLPLLLEVLGTPRDPRLRDAVEKLRAWMRSGAHRIDRDRDGVYEHNDAIVLMDAWWPRLMHAQFEPVLGKELFDELEERVQLDNEPNYAGEHRGAAYEDGWYGYASRDLRTLLGRRVRGRYPLAFCGRGSRGRCRQAIARSLADALAVTAAQLYSDDEACAKLPPERMAPCYDEIRFQVAGVVEQDPIPFQNRPTYQQVVEVQRRLPR
jgi:acyl-homoserine lactone acylase PvdQ